MENKEKLTYEQYMLLKKKEKEDSDAELLDEIDEENEEEIKEEIKEKKHLKKSSNKKIYPIDKPINKPIEEFFTTEGTTMTNETADTGRLCAYCNKIFNEDMIAQQDEPELMCYHCLFFLNYDPHIRKTVDGVYGMTIAEYILKCSGIHMMDTCGRNSDNGGCFLCEYNIGLEITDIKDGHKLKKDGEYRDDGNNVTINLNEEPIAEDVYYI